MANQIERLYGKEGVHALSVHPGGIRSGAQRHDDPAELAKLLPGLLSILKTTSQGAATTVWAAVGKVWEGVGAKYLEDMREGHMAEKFDVVAGGYAPFVFDEEAEVKLWKLSEEMTGTRSED